MTERDRIYRITGHCDECKQPLRGRSALMGRDDKPASPQHKGTPKKLKRRKQWCVDCARWIG